MKKYVFNLATKKDVNQLIFKHYKNQKIARKRAECYTSHNFTSVARDQNRIIGTIQWYVKEDPSLGLVEFEEIFISEKYRGKGLGLELLRNAITHVRNYFKKEKLVLRRIYLFVSKDNLAARRLYEKTGFRKVANVGDLFKDKTKELLYVLKIK
jgi:ribosomal protein S18 acetylase RimI-like enzyme